MKAYLNSEKIHINPLTLNQFITNNANNAKSAGKGIIVIGEDGSETLESYSDLYKNAKRILYVLQKKGFQQGSFVILELVNPLHFIRFFWACILGGIVPVPLSVPMTASTETEAFQKLLKVSEQLSSPYIVTENSTSNNFEAAYKENALNYYVYDDLIQDVHEDCQLADIKVDDIAYIQYSSGSTGDPKGVVLTHKNLYYNVTQLSGRLKVEEKDVAGSWMPLTHDMGLVGYHLTPVFKGITHFILSPNNFIKKPLMFLEKISKFHVSITASPNFGLSWMIDKIGDDKLNRIDLSSLQKILCGAEPISMDTVRRFYEKFSACGLKPHTVYQVYGMAEACVGVTLPKEENNESVFLNRRSNQTGTDLLYISADDEDAAEFAIVGEPLDGMEVAIFDDDDQLLNENQTGNVMIKGPNVFSGYLNRGDEPFTADGFFRTGDLGFIRNGKLGITGRKKDVIFVNGQNYYSSDIESVLEMVLPSRNTAVVCAYNNPHKSRDEIVVFVRYNKDIKDFLPIFRQVKATIFEKIGVAADYIIPIKKIPKTTSGKPQRYILINQFTNHEYDDVVDELNRIFLQAGLENTEIVDPVISQTVLEIAKNTFELKDIDLQNDFLTMGIDSLRLIQFLDHISSTFKRTIPISSIIENNTVQKFCAYIEKQIKGSEYFAEVLPDCQSNCEKWFEPFELTEVQKAYLMGRQSAFELGEISTHAYYEIETELDIKRFSDALNRVILRQPMLRAVFYKNGTQQVLAHVPYYQVDIEDLSRLSVQEQNTRIIKRRDKMSHHVFQCDKWPLFDFRAFKLTESRNYLFVGIDLLISDGSSMLILLREVMEHYHHPDIDLTEFEFSFYDYIFAYNQLKQSVIYRQDHDYWFSKVEKFPMAPQLPVICDPETIEKPVFKRLEKNLSADRWHLVKKLAKEKVVTPSVLLCTIYAEVLCKWSNQPALAINFTVFNRHPFHPDVSRLIGDFTSIILVDVDLSADTDFWERAKRIQRTLFEALDHISYSGVDFIREIAKSRDLGGRAVMPIVFTSMLFGDVEDGADDELDSWGELKYGISQTPQVYLDFQAMEHGNRLSVTWDYVFGLFDETMISEMFQAYCTALDSLADKSTGRILLPAADQRFVEQYNATNENVHSDFLHKLIDEQCRRTPDAVAVKLGNATISYAELEKRSNQTARCLLEQGCSRGQYVGILAQRKIETIVNIVAVLKAGCAYVPVSPEHPEDRIEYILRHSNCSILLRPEFYEKNGVSKYADSTVDLVNEDGDAAYVIYTSGSTGRPKGVIISHKAASNTIVHINEKFGIGLDDKIIALSSMCFDLSVYDVFGALISGAQLVLVPDLLDVDNINRIVTEEGITVWNSVPAVMDMLISSRSGLSESADYWNMGNHSDVRIGFNDTLRLVMLSGDWIPLSLPEKVKQYFPCAEVISLGGATEASIWSIYYPIDTVDTAWKSIPYGYPLANQRVYVLDNFLEECPVGVQGELFIAGAGVAQGYLNDAEKTAAAFIHHPRFGTVYKTGDYGVLSRKGYIEFLGRKDNQVKIRGHRIELGEIENCISGLPGIQNAVVTDLTNPQGQKYLCGYFVEKAKIETAAIHEYLSAKLPDYMIPSILMRLKEIPLTSNGKVDRRKLPDPEFTQNFENTGVEARNETERHMAAIWKSILNIENVGIDDDFFELGGDSLKGAMLISRIHKELKAEIPLREIFQNPTIRAMSLYVQLDEKDIFSDITRTEKKEYYDVSASQRRMYILNQMDRLSKNYNTPGVVEIKGKLDTNRVRQVIQQLINRHESLRTSFFLSSADGKIVQKIQDHLDLEIETFQTDGMDTDQQIKKILKAFIRPFDLGKAPLFRAAVIKTDNRYILAFDTHHIISDGISKELLISEFAALYNGTELPVLQIQYKDYAVWQNEVFFKSAQFARQEKYWIDRFKNGISTLNLPTDFTRPAIQSFEGDRIYFTLHKDVTEVIDSLRETTGVTRYMVLLAALDIVLGKYSNQDDIIVGTPVAGRKIADLYKIFGNFINTLAVSNHMNADQTLRTFLESVKSNTIDVFENQDYPFEELVEKINLQRDTSRNPIFDVLLSLQNMKTSKINIDGLEVAPYEIENRISKFDISIIVYESNDELKLEVEYNTKLFKEESIRKLIVSYEKVLKYAMQNLDAPLKEIEVIGDAEKKQILDDFNCTETIYDRKETIVDWFEAQVRKTPNAPAITFSGSVVSYDELNQYSNQLARLLREKGVDGDCIVGVFVDRSAEMMIGILAVLKAGGCYLPIDPTLPANRIRYMLTDSGTKVVLTQKKYFNILPNEVTAIDLMSKDLYTGKSSDLIGVNRKQSDLAYLLYTSGSTGVPKGVMVEQKALCNFLAGVTQRIGFHAGSRILALTTISFDIFNLETLIPLCKGLEVVVADERDQKDPKRIRQIIAGQSIDILQMTPTRIQMILENSSRKDFSSVKTLMVGGEALSEALLCALKEKFSSQIYNMYGPTETTVWSCIGEVSESDTVHIGTPIANTKILILDRNGQLCPIGVPGELCIMGDGLARGYLNNPDLTIRKFVECIYTPENKIYKTGDLAKWRPDGKIECMGRSDHQVKIRGYRIELGEIEGQMKKIEGVRESAVIAREDKWNEKKLYAYYTADKPLGVPYLREEMQKVLPSYMVPSFFLQIDKIPVTQNGKIDRKALPEPQENQEFSDQSVPCSAGLDEKIKKIWEDVLGISNVRVNDNFFDLGGNSLGIVRLSNMLSKELNQDIEVMTLFQYPSISSFIKYLTENKIEFENEEKPEQPLSDMDIAVIGMAGRFPKAQNLDAFWDNLKSGRECISFLTEKELMAAGVPDELLKNPKYVRAAALLQDIEYFDADFFGFSQADAECMDPQTRIFTEVAWESLEDAGYDPDRYQDKIGLFAGASNDFLWQYLTFMQTPNNPSSIFNAMQLNDKQFLPTIVSYKLNLKGPSVYINTACSTALVAIHTACRSLINGECGMALAGAVNATQSKKEGYLYEDGMILSKDGHCRPFDEQASGTVFGNGAGIVVLKPLKNAIRDRDQIYSVIKGSAVNNDGRDKVGFTAPGIHGQRDVIKKALIAAKVPADSISYIEAHGTGTPLGDPVEVAALKLAYSSKGKQSCAIGSVKSNIGHMDVAAGIAGFIKTALAIKYRALPPSLHFVQENPKLLLADSPFYVNTELKAWENKGAPLRAGVSSFGIGGTNAHIILEQAPEITRGSQQDRYAIINLSARTRTALSAEQERLCAYLSVQGQLRLLDIAYTLGTGRKEFKFRKSFVCENIRQAAERLSVSDPAVVGDGQKSIVFMFPGQGAQYFGMGRELYENIESFRADMEACFSIAERVVPWDVKAVLFEKSDMDINQTEVAQVVLYTIEYCLAKLLVSWGIMPEYMIGHSIGEYVAATLAGVITPEEGILLVSARGKLMQAMPKGAMLSVMLDKQMTMRIATEENVSVAAVNSTNMCVLSGQEDSIQKIQIQLSKQGIACIRLKTSHAYHSEMMRRASVDFLAYLQKIKLKNPVKKYYSNVTGSLIKGEQATDPEYWITHMLSTVQFEKGISEVLKDPKTVLLEIGPGKALSTLVKMHELCGRDHVVVPMMKSPKDGKPEDLFLLEKLAILWENGIHVDWEAYYRRRNVRKTSLPAYPFERKRYWAYAEKTGLGNLLQPRLKNTDGDSVILLDPAEHMIRKIEDDGLQSSPEIKEPHTDTEKALAAIMESILLIKPISIHDNFYEMGGDSMKCIMLRTSIQKELSVEIPLEELFKRQTVQEIAQYVDAVSGDIGLGEQIEIKPAEKQNFYDVSSTQERIFMVSRMRAGDVSYNLPDAIELSGKVDAKKIEAVIRKLIERHEAFRTSFEIREDKVVQRIEESADFQLIYKDISTDVHKESLLDGMVHSFIRPFDLSKAPILRVELLRTEEKKFILLFDMHHIIADGTSMGIIMRDFVQLYSGKTLPALNVQLKDYVAWQKRRLASNELIEQERYWLKNFEGDTPILKLPTDYPRPEEMSMRGDRIYSEIGEGMKKEIDRVARLAGTTQYMVLLTTYYILLSKHSGQDDIVVGVAMADRMHAELQNVVGMLVNSIPMRNRINGQESFLSLVNRVRLNAMSAYRNQDYPLEQLVNKLHVRRNKNRNPLFDTMFTQQSKHYEFSELQEFSIKRYPVKNKSSMFDLVVYVNDDSTHNKLLLEAEYSTDLFKKTYIDRLLDDYIQLLGACIENPDMKIKDMNLGIHVEDMIAATKEIDFNLSL